MADDAEPLPKKPRNSGDTAAVVGINNDDVKSSMTDDKCDKDGKNYSLTSAKNYTNIDAVMFLKSGTDVESMLQPSSKIVETEIKSPEETESSIQNDTCQSDEKDNEKTKEKQDENISKHSNTDHSGTKSETKQTSLTEVQAGITEYMGDHSGFSAILKQRYSDFIVNEINLEGNTVHLTSLQPPADVDGEVAQETSQDTVDVISADDLAKLDILSQAEDKTGTVNITAPDVKELRTRIHLRVKRQFPQLETKTVEEGDKKFIQVLWRKGGSSSRSSSQMEWPASKKSCPYIKFVLYKENKDTMDAIGLMAKNLHVKESLFQFAGTKDKRAKTSQEITAHKIHPKKLAFLNKVLFNMGVGNFRYVTEPLKLGHLRGNNFTIVLRNVQGSQEIVDQSLMSLKSRGFINYFGLQRFGTTSVPTHHIGRALLQGDWEKAVDLILKPRDDHPNKDRFHQVWAQTKDPEATLNLVPKFCGLERCLLGALKMKLKPLNALEKISRNTRLLYVHSYQSRVWNLMTSRRLRELGHQVVVGDLVLIREHGTDSKSFSDHPKPTVVTSDNIKDFSMKDIVLPLPGYDVIYPDNGVQTWYRSALTEDGLDIDSMKRAQKDYSLSGAYRHLTVFPTDVTVQHCRYNDFTVPLTLTDLDKVKGNTSPPQVSNKGKLRAVLLEMSLPQSCYATMALREVLRADTSVAHQTSLNVT